MLQQTFTSLLSSKRSNHLASRGSFGNSVKLIIAEDRGDREGKLTAEGAEKKNELRFSLRSSSLAFLCALCAPPGYCGYNAFSSPLYKSRHGFTLLELLLVLVIIGVGAALVGARLSGLRDTTSIDMAAKRLRDQARVCQDMAVANAQIVRLRVNTEQMTVDIEPINTTTGMIDERHAPLIALRQGADDVKLTFERSDGVAPTNNYVDVLFYPDLRCDPPGRFTLASQQRFASVYLAAGAQKPTATTSRPIEFRRRLQGDEQQGDAWQNEELQQ